MIKKYKQQHSLIVFSFLLIPVTLLLLFLIYPTFKLLQLSFTNWDGTRTTFDYIGFKNYKNIFINSKDVWISLRNNLIYFGTHIIAIPLEIIASVLLCKKACGMNFFKSVTFMPYMINGVAVAYMFSFFYSPIGGPLNAILASIGLESLQMNWLSNVNIVNFSLAGVSLWRFCGLHIILFISGIKSVPKDYYEAAEIDGASFFQKLWYITIPGIKRVIEMVLFLNVRGALQVFDIPFLITNGGPGFASSTFTTYTLDTAFKYDQFGMASAMAVVLMLIICFISLMQKRFVKIRG